MRLPNAFDARHPAYAGRNDLHLHRHRLDAVPAAISLHALALGQR
ncbi:MAG TPA: hypothetical protein VGO18_06415 [Steroidobacteraceae bacterium]|nr:hypothetical protein [Steroidobacteraceae bacterium]